MQYKKEPYRNIIQKYPVEDILSVVAALTEQYTSKESTSVSYETAQSLMTAVLYCLNEGDEISTADTLTSSITLHKTQQKPNCKSDYESGYQAVIQKAERSKDLYHRILVSFEDYGCSNYYDTVIKGFPAFFTHYDPKFSPQDTILTLDYPLMKQEESTGIDCIYTYLTHLSLEKLFLDFFPAHNVRELLSRITPDYRRLYLDNICHEVLFLSLCCILTHTPVTALTLNKQSCNQLKCNFAQSSVADINLQLSTALSALCSEICKHTQKEQAESASHLFSYFSTALHGYAFRIHNGIEYDCLPVVLYSAL